MKFELELWHVISLCVTVFGAFFAVAKMLLVQVKREIDKQFDSVGESFKGMSEQLTRQDETARRLERDLMDLKAQLPRDYVRREDYTQAVATIMTKIDNMSLRVESYFRELVGGKRE